MRPIAPLLRPPSRRGFVLLLALACLAGRVTGGEPPVITDPGLVWALPTEQKGLRHPLRIEGRVNYFEEGFKLLWIERNGVSEYLQVSANPPPLRTGQYVAIEGTIVPQHGLDAADVTVRVVREHDPVVPLDTQGRINDLVALGGRIVRADAYVDTQLTIDAEHERLTLIVENRPVICWVRPDDPARPPDWRGRQVRVTGLYSSRFDPTTTRATIEFWTASQAAVEVLGDLANSPAFQRPVTPVNEIYRHAPGTELRIRGRLEHHEPGESLILRDGTGEVKVESIQSNRVAPGSMLEAAGRVDQADRWILAQALYRQIADEAPAAGPVPAGPLTRIADIRALGQAEAAAGRPVDIKGMVTWSLPDSDSDIMFVQDPSGGIRVQFDRAKTGRIAYGKYFNIKGVTRPGSTTPVVELQTYVDLGAMSHPRARPVSLEQALTGRHDGEWVELRGFLRHTSSEGEWRWIHVTTPAGEFVGHLQSAVNFVANPGALISLRGVCDTAADAGGRVTKVVLRVPFLHDIGIEQDAPADYYDLPPRALEDLDQLGAGRELQRVRVTGTVVHAVPGRLFYLQEGRTGLLALSQGKEPLQAGDRVEAVGILGREGVHTILREAVYRRTGSGPAPAPETLPDITVYNPVDDFRLVRVRGRVLGSLTTGQQTRITLQHGRTLFEARLDQVDGRSADEIAPGAEVELAGIYKVTFDDTQQPRGFEIYLRGPGDLAVVNPPPLLDIRRALMIVGVLAGCVMLGLAWIYSLRRRVRMQTEEIREHMEQQARREAGVQNAARLESLGVLAGGIAHDYNNLLTVIMGNLSLMKLSPRIMETEAHRVAEIERGVLRARDLARQLLTFATGGEPLREPLNMADMVRTATETVLRGTNVRAEYAVEPGLWAGEGDRDQLVQAVQNVVLNALQAMPAGGVLRVSLANAAVEPAAANGTQPGRYIRLGIADTGTGIAPAVLPKIFDPYFTTRRGARGLGLATVYSIVNRHGGRVEAASVPGQGTTLTLWLPATMLAVMKPPAAETPAAAPEAAAAPAAKPRVLLMDDEEGVRVLASAVLERMGLDVTAVPDGESALHEFELARNAGRPYALLIVDLTIPGGLGGRETVEAVRKVDPRVPAIVSSGYSSDPVMANFQNYGFQAVVPKPFEVATLANAVRRFIPQAKPI